MQNALEDQETKAARCRGTRKATKGTGITLRFEKALLNISIDSHNNLGRGEIYHILPSVHRKMHRGLEKQTDLPNRKRKC